jgi:hypothetical protein
MTHDDLRERVERIAKRLDELIVGVAKITEIVQNLTNEVRRISETLSYGFEDMARAVVPGWLYKHEGIEAAAASPTAALQSVMGRPPPAASPSPPPLQPRALGPPPCGGPPDGGLKDPPLEAAFPQGNGLRRCARGFINSTLRSPKVIFSKLKVK